MNKKFLTVAAVLAVFAAFSVSAASKKSAAIGIQGGADAASYAGTGNVDITFKLSSLPCVFAGGLYIGNSNLSGFGITADWWLKNPKLGGMFHYYYGPGVAFSSWFGSYMFVGFRAVAGVNIFVIPELELYLQAAWQPGIYFTSNGLASNDWWRSFPVNFGFRFWF